MSTGDLREPPILIDEDKIEARFYVGFPARGRSVLSKELEDFIQRYTKHCGENFSI